MMYAALPDDVIAIWPEIFGMVAVRKVPLSYVDHIKVMFNDGTIWRMDAPLSPDDVACKLQTLINDYVDDIDSIDMKLDAFRLKYDIQSFADSFKC